MVEEVQGDRAAVGRVGSASAVGPMEVFFAAADDELGFQPAIEGELTGAGCKFYAGDQAIEELLPVGAGIFHSWVGTGGIDRVEEVWFVCSVASVSVCVDSGEFAAPWRRDGDAVDEVWPRFCLVFSAVVHLGFVESAAVPAGTEAILGVWFWPRVWFWAWIGGRGSGRFRRWRVRLPPGRVCVGFPLQFSLGVGLPSGEVIRGGYGVPAGGSGFGGEPEPRISGIGGWDRVFWSFWRAGRDFPGF